MFTRISILLYFFTPFSTAKLAVDSFDTSPITEIEGFRFGLHKFGLTQFKEFWLFGYGAGAFGLIFKLFYKILPGGGIANHVHNDGIELIGEVGIIGISILLLLSLIYVKKLLNNINQERERARFILLSLLLIILFIQSLVDFSLHVPGITILLVVILSFGLINFKNISV